MNWQHMNWPLALLIDLGLLAMFVVELYWTYLPIKYMKEPADSRFHFRWLLGLQSFWVRHRLHATDSEPV
jgi:hypothetical protein